MNQLNLKLAGYSLAIKCSDEKLSYFLGRELVTFTGGHGEDMLLRIELVRDLVMPVTIHRDARVVSPVPGLQVILRTGIEDGELCLEAKACKDSDYEHDDDDFLHPILLNTLLFSYLQHLTSKGLAKICLIHACAAIRDGQAVLFAGRSGAGKSTVARLLMEDCSFQVIGDDMILVSRSETGWLAHAAPLGGDIPSPLLSNVSAPLQAIYFLSQEGAPGYYRQDTTEALASLMSSVVPAHEIRNTAQQTIDEYDHESLTILMRDASLLASEVPSFSLTYILDEPPWGQLFKFERSREGK